MTASIPASAAVRLTVPPGGLKAGEPIDVALSPLAVVPVELALGPTTPNPYTGVPPTPASFALSLESSDSTDPGTIRLTQTPAQTFQFQVPPGRYRLKTASAGGWWPVSISTGVSNLLTDELVVGEGGGASVIRIVGSNLTGHLDGTVRLPDGATSARIYLLPREPSLVPFYSLRASTLGTFSRNLPLGHYAVVAVAQTVEADVSDPRVAAKLAAQGKLVEITAEGKASVDLELGPGLEAAP